jgi:endoglucanase
MLFTKAARCRAEAALTNPASLPAPPSIRIAWTFADSTKDLRPLSDHNVVYSFQCLAPLNFTQQGNPDNDDWKNLRGVPYSAKDAAAMRKAFVGAGSWARQYGLPVLVTAFAVHDTAPKADRLRRLRDVRVLVEEQQFAWTVWSWQGNAGFGLSGGGLLPSELKRTLGLPK